MSESAENRIEVAMPQLGESIAEGTLVRWYKKVGDRVERDEVLFEISTDKVDSEIPSPEAGYVERILVSEGETVPVHTTVCVLSRTPPTSELRQPRAAAREPESAAFSRATEAPVRRSAAPPPSAASTATFPGRRAEETPKTSPLVRRLAAEHGVRLEDIRGSGIGGRVTKEDVLRHLKEREASAGLRLPEGAGAPQRETPTESAGDRLEPMSPMRQQIADHLSASIRTAVHATTVFEVDMTRVREAKSYLSAKLEETHNIRFTYLPFIVQATARALRKFPVMNASIEERMVRYHAEINIGIAVALDDGLIVPVLRRADTLHLVEIAKTIQDLARRARAKELNPSDVQGGTFTITNPGLFGGIMGTPILHQPQVGILYVGAVTKRPVVLPDSDAIAIRSMAYLCLSIDHRLIDGAVADRFLASIKATLESGDFDAGPFWR